MSTEKPSKINHLLATTPSGIVMQSFWLKEQGYSLDLQRRYRTSRWLEGIGSGAMIRSGDQVSYEGALYALQQQSGMSVHPAGRTALSFLGKTHYLELSSTKATVFGGKGEALPSWFKTHKWETKVDYHQTSFLPIDMGLTEVPRKSFMLKVSSAERAILECLYLAPQKQELLECYELLEGLNNLRPSTFQKLLEECQSIKVKRLFLFMAEKAGHEWFQYLDINKIDLGTGKRSIVKNGAYNAKYKITIPKELDQYDSKNV